MNCPVHKTLLAAAISATLAAPALANPTGPKVTHGSASFAQPGPGQLHITNSPGTIINWQGFSIGANELTRFIQQNSGSAVLNRVVGGLPSDILGQLASNGRVFLINPNGLVIGNGAKIDTAGFIASTLNITDADFLAGRLNFAGGGGKIENRGYIRAGQGGEVVLLAPDIENSGVIESDGGKILLAAGREITLASLDLEGVQFKVQAPSDRVLNLGELIAHNGAVGVFAGTLTHSGAISATRASRGADGLVRLEAGDRAEIFGSIDASGTGDAPGGTITATAPTVALRGPRINASGPAGGGTVLVGGDYQGGGSLKRSQRTDVDAATTIRADATASGPGGKIVIWSDGDTSTHGLLTARGGPQGGDGGLIETSGKGTLDFSTPADVSAAKGRPGTWLLDPEDITIDDGRAASIETALNAGSSVAIRTSGSGTGEGNIEVNSSITKTEGGDAALSMEAHNRIDVNAPISSAAGRLDVSLSAGRAVNVNSTIRTNGGDFSTTLTGTATATTAASASSSTATSNSSTASTSAPSTGTGSPVSAAAPSSGTSSSPSASSNTPASTGATSTGNTTTASTAGTASAGGASSSSSTTQQTVALASNSAPPPATTTTATSGTSAPSTGSAGSSATTTAGGVAIATGTSSATSSGTSSSGSSGTNQTQTANTAGTSSPTTTSTTNTTAATSSEPAIRVNGEVTTSGGDIFVDSGPDGTTYIHGTLDASNRDAGGKGGSVTLLGDKVGLFDKAKVDASGDAGGGTVLIGGDRQGLNPEVRNASAVYVGAETSVKADALTNGDGGKIIVFADTAAQVYGKLSARGGSEGGNGGFIETSGLVTLILDTVPDVSAPKGKGGEWLIDPHYDLEITDNTTSVNTSGDPWFPTGSGAMLDVADIRSFFLTTTNGTLTVTTENAGGTESGNITWNGDMDTDGFGSGDTLNLIAGGNITFGDTTSFSGAIYDGDTDSPDSLNLNLTANGTVTFNAVNSEFSPDVSLDTGAGNVTSNAPVLFYNDGFGDPWYVGGNLTAPSVTVEEIIGDSLYVTGSVVAADVTLKQLGHLDVGGSLNVTNTLTIQDNAWLSGNGTGQTANFNWTGTNASQESELALALTTTGTASVSGPSGKLLSAEWINQGTATWTGGDILFDDGRIRNEGVFHAGTAAAPGNMTMVDNDGSDQVFENLGTFNSNPGSGNTLTVDVNVDFSNSGTLNLVSGTFAVPDLDMNSGGLTGNGTIDGNVTFTGTNAGFIAPGASPGTITIMGNLTLASNTTVNLDANGTGPGQYDVINVTGNIDFGGATASVGFSGGFAPAVGNIFPFITYGSNTGSTAFTALNSPAGYTLGQAYSPSYLVSVLGIPPPPPPPPGSTPPTGTGGPTLPTGGGPTPPFPDGPTNDLLVLWYQDIWTNNLIDDEWRPDLRRLGMCK